MAPYTLAMILCDGIHRDPGTGKHTLLGLFSVLYAEQFPTAHPNFNVYACLTDGRGKTPIEFRIVVGEDERIVAQIPAFEVEFPDPRAQLELCSSFRNVTFSEPGEYRIQLYGGGEFLLERRLLVMKMQRNTQ